MAPEAPRVKPKVNSIGSCPHFTIANDVPDLKFRKLRRIVAKHYLRLRPGFKSFYRFYRHAVLLLRFEKPAIVCEGFIGWR
jgi:hypothetical protein